MLGVRGVDSGVDGGGEDRVHGGGQGPGICRIRVEVSVQTVALSNLSHCKYRGDTQF